MAIDWQAIRRHIERERGPCCEICKTAPWSELHHCVIHDMSRYHKLLSVPENLQAVCKPCHQAEARSRSNREAFIAAQLERGYDLAAWVSGLPFKVPVRI